MISLLSSLLGNNNYASLINTPPAAMDLASDALLDGFTSRADARHKSSVFDDPFLLDLSLAAQQVLMQLGGHARGEARDSGGFLLSGDQKDAITGILSRYRDAPYTQATYTRIQNDLRTSGLSPEQLAMKDTVQSFDPVSLLIDAIGGTGRSGNIHSLGGLLSRRASDAKSNHYEEQIIKQWQSVSSGYTPDMADAVTPTSGVA